MALPKSPPWADGDVWNATAVNDQEQRVADAISAGGNKILLFSRPGNLGIETGVARMFFPVAATIVSVTATVSTAPTGQSLIVDIHKNGTTVFTTQGNRPTIAAAGNSSSAAVPDVTAISANQYLTLDIDQVGSTITGADLTVAVLVT